jgi:glutathione S-transferase
MLGAVTPTLYVVPGSHPCAAVRAALALKGIGYDQVDFLPVVHRLQGRLLYGARTVPGLRLDSGERLAGSRAIMRRLDELAPDPALYPASGDEARKLVERADEWGDEVLQPLVRRLVWAVLERAPRSMESYSEGAGLPVPAVIARPGLPLVARASARLNQVSDASTRSDLLALPGHLDRVDRWVAGGLLGGAQPNAADLQIGASLQLALTLDDLRPLIAGRPGARLVEFLAPIPGTAPAVLPAGWLPPPATPAEPAPG